MADRIPSPEIAILGYGCRLPGAADPEAFWRLLTDRRCAIGRIGPDRWAEASFFHPDRAREGAIYVGEAGLLDDPFGFDAAFFGVSPREAAQMDPQQRLALHVGWEAIERGGVAPARMSGPRVGVYVGASGLDYSNTLLGDPALAQSHFMTGNTLSIIANRLAYFLDAQGPSYVLDTACSSSLFAFHAACEAIRRGEIDRALVAGVNMLLSPMPFIGFCRAGMLSPTGRCHAFDARADGYVRAEGAVAFVIGRLDQARAAGDRVRGVVIGSGVNSDGRASLMTVPNGARQQALMDEVWRGAGLGPERIAFLEAHGTGTPVGDPIEARAIGAALAADRSRPLPVGSVKSNIGHLEPASGLAGLLKAQLALEMGLYPANAGLQTPNPDIPFEALNLAPAVEPVALTPGGDEVWSAGVNSFGFGGANAHVALRQPRADEMPSLAAVPSAAAPLLLSAATETALRTLALRWRDRLRETQPDAVASLISSAARRRARLPRRLVVTETEPEARLAALAAYAEGRETSGAVTGVAASRDPAPVAFVFAGNGSQWPGMGLQAYRDDVAFRESFDQSAAAVLAEGGPDLREALNAPDLEARLDEAMTAQTLLLALQMAMVEGLAARGVRPAAALGHSVGEVAAAWCAGALTREQAARIAVRRARAQAPLHGVGAMAAALGSVVVVEALIAGHKLPDLTVAADNSPRSVTLSGDLRAIEAFSAVARQERLAVKKLNIAYPFHGPALERIRSELFEALADLTPASPRLPLFSSTDGRRVEGPALDAGYWWRNARRRVRFREAALALAESGVGVCLEIGPQPVLQAYMKDTFSASGSACVALTGFRRRGEGREDLARIVAQVLAEGGQVDEDALFGPTAACPDAAPSYPWECARHRLEPAADTLNLLRRPAPARLLGWRARGGEGPWRRVIDLSSEPWLADHAVDGAPVLPAAALVELALSAGRERWSQGGLELLDFEIGRPVSLERGAKVEVRTTLEESGAVRIESRNEGTGTWSLNASGRIRPFTGALTPEEPIEEPEQVAESAQLYRELSETGLTYGAAFARLDAISLREEQAAARLRTGSATGPWTLDPTALDASFHLLAPLLARAERQISGAVYVPVRIGRLRLTEGSAPASAVARLDRIGARAVRASFALRDSEDRVLARVEEVRFQALRLKRETSETGLYWREVERPLHSPEGRVPPIEWREPALRLAQLGLTSDAAAEPGPAALLLDAAARRVIWEAARALAPEGGVRFRARRALAVGPRRALTLGLHALAEDGCYDPGADRVAEAPPTPPLEELAQALAVEAPDRIDRMVALLRLAQRLRGVEAAESARPETAIPSPVWSVLRVAIEDRLARRPCGGACDVALVGRPPAALVETLRSINAGRLGVAASSGELSGVFDFVVVERLDRAYAAGLAALAAPGALLLGVEPKEDLADALLGAAEGLEAGPPSEERLAQAGFDDVAAASSEAGRLVVARAAAAAASPQGSASGPIHVLSTVATASLARRLAEELSRRGRAADAGGWPASVRELVAFGPGPACGAAELAGVLDQLRQALEALKPDRLWLVARGGAVSASAQSYPGEAGFARISRVLVNERPDLAVRVVDIGPDANDSTVADAAAAIVLGSAEPETRLGGGRLAPRVEADDGLPRRAEAARRGAHGALRLGTDPLGGLETLRWRPADRRAPGPGEVEIRVAAAGLNFRDVMWAMGVLPEEAIEDGFSGSGLGMECAGVIERVGHGVRRRPGDRVVAFAAGAFSSHVVAPEAAVGHVPEGVSLAEAATLPVAFATAWRGLVDLGRLERGETVLVHGGAGGVGLAALAIARARGARVLATAGSPEKRELLRLLGAEAVFDSRTLDFDEKVMAATAGEGVDVALNSLSGEAMERTLACMRPFGRFIELGKRDFYAASTLPMRPLRRNVAYFGVDLDAMLAQRPESARPLLEELARALASGDATPLPHQVLSGEDALAAFRLMQRSGHIGKIVLTPPPVASAEALAPPAPLVRPEAAYLIAGGARGFGLKLAERLFQRGARRLWLTNRTGALSDEAAAVVARLRTAGCAVEVAAADVADEPSMAALLERIDGAGAPLRGVAHAAMRLDDGLFANLDEARLTAALRAKFDGAGVLDRLTRGRTLDWFILFSSISALFGNPGQAAYVAANAALEAVAAERLRAGEPAVAIQFGPIADAGVLAHDATARARLERKGAGVLASAAALDALETVLAGRSPETAAVAIAPMRWGALADDLPLLGTPLFESVDLSDRSSPALPADLVADLASLEPAAASARVLDLLRAEAATILRLPQEAVSPTRPLSELGFDSLMAVELKLSVEEKFGLALPALALSDGATLSALSARAAAELRGAGATARETPAGLVARHAGGALSQAIQARLDEREPSR